MVTVIDFKKRELENGKQFYVLVVQGEVETVRSLSSGNVYFTTKKATIPATFDEVTCKSLIGKQFNGSIKKEECEEYTYKDEVTGDLLLLTHRNVYVDNELDLIEEQVIDELEVE